MLKTLTFVTVRDTFGAEPQHELEEVMGIVYLDEKNTVRFDPSPDGKLAERADWNRNMLSMVELTLRQACLVNEILALQGRPPIDPELVDDIETLGEQVWARSIAETIPL